MGPVLTKFLKSYFDTCALNCSSWTQGLGQTEYHFDGKEDEESGDDLDEGENEDDLGGYLLVSPPRQA